MSAWNGSNIGHEEAGTPLVFVFNTKPFFPFSFFAENAGYAGRTKVNMV
jgi:hypothetical protein